MACRIGITTNPGERKRYWETQHSNLNSWTILERHNSKSDAQAAETRLAQQHGCVAAPGGADADGVWVVYKFEY